MVDLLILGAGWTSTFLIPLCDKRQISWAATTRDGRDNTIAFAFDPVSDDETPYKALPDAQTVLITFPLTLDGAPTRLVKLYKATRKRLPDVHAIRFIQLGTASIWGGVSRSVRSAAVQAAVPAPKQSPGQYDRHSLFAPNERTRAEDELLSLQTPGTILHLSGLWGGTRNPRNWVPRVAATKEQLADKTSLHLLHGQDVARAILAVSSSFEASRGQRWLLTDGKVHDWWDLITRLIEPDSQQYKWVHELMVETGVKELPREKEALGRILDSTEFWQTFGLKPEMGDVIFAPPVE